MRRLPASVLALVCGLAGLLIGACGRAPREVYPGAPVILISVDTLRSDRLPAYGYREIATPAIDAFRRDAVLFERAYSHYPLTLPSHVSILTGLLPSRHGVRDNVGYPLRAAEVPYWPRALKAAGYRTGAAVSSFVLSGDLGVEESFDLYDDAVELKKDVTLGGLQRPGAETIALALRWLEDAGQGDRSAPVFLFLHLYEPHSPYQPPPPHDAHASPYDGEIAYTDSLLADFFDRLRALGLYEPAIIVLLSDHGEGLGEHGEQEHGIFLYRESLQVPLLVKLPGARRGGTTVRETARLIDVFPTVLALLGLPVPPEVQGRPLLPSPGDGEREVYAETYYPRLHMGWSELAALIRDDHHYIEAPDPELYDLASDPGETRNLVALERRLFAALRADLAPYRAELARPAEASPETLAKLTALGYVGAANAAREGPLPDPKSEIHTLEDFKTAAQLMARQQWAAAIPLLERTLERSPRMQDAWERLVLCLGRSGRRAEALAAQRRALENSGGAAQPALALAGMLLQVGRADEARAHAELALAGAPGLAHRLLAEIALEVQDLDEAERRARAAVAEDPDQPASLLLLVQVLGRRGGLEEAGEVMAGAERAAAASATFPPGFHLARGDLAARLGRAAEARRDFEEEIRRNPEVLDAHARLAALQAAQGESLAAWKTLQRMVELNHDSPAAYGSAVETLRVLGDGETAARLLRHARRLHPGDPYLQEMGGG